MQSTNEFGGGSRNFLSNSDNVQCSGCRIDDGSAGNSRLDRHVGGATVAGVAGSDRCNACSWIDKTYFPERARTQALRFEGIDAIVLRGHVNDIVETLPGNAHVGHVE